MDWVVIPTIVIALLALGAVVRGAMLVKAGARDSAASWMLFGASLMMLMLVVLLLTRG